MSFYKEHQFLAQATCCLMFRSCRSQMFFKTGPARKFCKFLWKTPELESVSNKVVGLQVFKPFFYGTPPVAASKISLSSADILFMCSLIFLLPEAILNAVNTTVKIIMWIQGELHLQLTLIFDIYENETCRNTRKHSTLLGRNF